MIHHHTIAPNENAPPHVLKIRSRILPRPVHILRSRCHRRKETDHTRSHGYIFICAFYDSPRACNAASDTKGKNGSRDEDEARAHLSERCNAFRRRAEYEILKRLLALRQKVDLGIDLPMKTLGRLLAQ